MAINFEEYQTFGKEQFEAVQAAATEVSKQLQAIAAETTDYSKKFAGERLGFRRKAPRRDQVRPGDRAAAGIRQDFV